MLFSQLHIVVVLESALEGANSKNVGPRYTFSPKKRLFLTAGTIPKNWGIVVEAF